MVLLIVLVDVTLTVMSLEFLMEFQRLLY